MSAAFTPTFEQSRRYFETRLPGQRIGSRPESPVKCLFHPDGRASLSINMQAGTWFCHACNIGGGLLDFERKLTGKSDAECWAAINTTIGREAPEAGKPKRGRIVEVYDYHDAAGNVVYQAVRYADPKSFHQRRPDGHGGWIWNMDSVTRVPFNLPALVRSNVALIAEGEKDAVNLQEAANHFPNNDGKLTYTATTNVGGAGKWLDEYSPYLAGKRVFVFHDNDDAGRKHAQQVLGSAAKHAQEVRLVELPGLAEHGDVSDYLKTHTPAELFELMKAASARPALTAEDDDGIGLKLKCAVDIVEKDQGYLVSEFLPEDTLIVAAGQIGLGKTTACLDWGASITQGRIPIIGGEREARNVLMLSNEDSEAQLRRTFTRLGGNLARLYVEDEDATFQWGLGDVPALEKQIINLHPALVIIDSLTTHKPAKVDLNSHGDVAPMLVALRRMAAQHGCAIVIIHHVNKAQTNDPLAKISGSLGISATARHVILFAQHPEDTNSRVAAIAKSNLVKFGAPSYKFQLEPFKWDGDAGLSAQDIVQVAPAENSPGPAEVFLLSQLEDGAKPVAELEKLGEKLGISRPTLYRAKKRLGLDAARSGFPAKAKWSLPQSSHQSSLLSETETTGDYSRDNNNTEQYLQGSGQLSQLSQSSHGRKGETTAETTEKSTNLPDEPAPSRVLPADPDNPTPDENTRAEGRFPGHGDAWEGPDETELSPPIEDKLPDQSIQPVGEAENAVQETEVTWL